MNIIQFQQRNRNFNDGDMIAFLHYFLSRLWDTPIVCHISHPIQYILKFLFYLPIIRWSKIIHEKYSFMRKKKNIMNMNQFFKMSISYFKLDAESIKLIKHNAFSGAV